MPGDDPSRSTFSADLYLREIRSARAQVEAARRRQPGLAGADRAPRPAAADLLAGKRLPGYTLLRELHRGGQGVVYLGRQDSTGREVAIKLLSRALPEGGEAAQLARFEREVEFLSQLKHPHVVTIHDCGRDHDHVYLVMDYVKGARLDDWVAAGPAGLRETLELFAGICDGVNAAHLRGVIHRDLKPGNILVDERGAPHVLDFGLAKLAHEAEAAGHTETMTATGQFVGSLPWASPEQAEGRTDELDVRTDVYSLGVVLYQLLTGRFPYPVAGRLAEVTRHIASTPPVRPSTLRREIDRDIETVLLKCLAKEPERRYQSAGELARDLRRYLAGEAIEARRDSLVYLTRKQLARYRRAAVAAAAVLVAVSGGLVVSLNFWRQAERQRTLAQENATAAVAAAQRADSEAAQARAANDFMRAVLTSVAPEWQGVDARLIDVLAGASQAAGKRFAALPQQEAQVRELLGEVYFDLALWREAEREYTAALRLRREHAGGDDPRTLALESTCAGVALNLGRYHEVERTLAALLPRMTRVLGGDARETLAAQRSLAIALLSQGRVDEAEAMVRALRAHPALAADDPMQLRLALTLIDTLHWRRALLPDGPQRRASLAEEEALAGEWLERATRVHGPDGAVTHQARVVLASIAEDQARHAEAAEACRDLLERTRGRLPDCHDVRALAMSVRARALGNLGAVEEPAALYLERIACIRAHGDPAQIALLSTITDALGYVDRAGRAAEGEALARELSAAMARYGDEPAFDAAAYVARFVSMQARRDEAETLFRALLAREAGLDDPRSRARLHLFYGTHLADGGEFARAEAELNSAADLLGDVRRGTRDTHPDDLVRAYVELYRAWQRPAQAAEFEKLREELRDRSDSAAAAAAPG